MIPKHPLFSRRGIVSGLSALSIAMTSVAPAALAQETSTLNQTQLQHLRQLAKQVRENAEAAERARAAEAKRTRGQLSDLDSTLQTLMQIMGQILSTQAGSPVEPRVDALIAEAEAQTTVMENAINTLADGAKTKRELELLNNARRFRELSDQVPDRENLQDWKPEDIERFMVELEQNVKKADKANDDYVEQEIIPALAKNCPMMMPDQRRAMVTDVLGGGIADIGAFLLQSGCEAVEYLVPKLLNALNSKEVQAAFQALIQNLLTVAILAGNLYIVAIVAALILITKLFSDGNGDGNGDGDGVDDQPGAPPPSSSSAPGEKIAPGPQQPDKDNEDTEDASPSDSDPLDPWKDLKIRADGGDPDVNAHPGVGCGYGLYDGDEITLTFSPPEGGSGAPFNVVITDVEGRSDYDNFPESWTDPNIRLISCDFEAPGVVVQVENEDEVPFCLRIARPNDAESGFEISEMGFRPGPNELCQEG